MHCGLAFVLSCGGACCLLRLFGGYGFLSGFGPGQLSSFIPSCRPISARSSLISLSDLRPKFLVLSISDSVFWTSSPMYLMLAFCRQFAERTLSSSSSTVRHRFSLSFSAASSRGASTGSAISPTLLNRVSCSLRILAAYATPSSGRTEPLVQHSRVSLTNGSV